ncbi:MAG TPA: cytochrome b/b6 domain-containing protein [Acidimicrobiales bacterium]|jgi:formate dehydrogenase subunit gamma
MTGSEVVRFDRLTRIVHWTTAVLGLAVLATGTILYVPELSAAIGLREVLKDVHVYSALLLPVPLLIGVLSGGPAGRHLRADLVELGRWSPTDWRWLRRRRRPAPAGKFNGGQKLVSAAFAGLFLMLLMSGSVMFWHDPFPDPWRTGATFVHDWAYIGILAATLGHLAKAVGDPDLMRAMRQGGVDREWARRERPTWPIEDDPAANEA